MKVRSMLADMSRNISGVAEENMKTSKYSVILDSRTGDLWTTKNLELNITVLIYFCSLK